MMRTKKNAQLTVDMRAIANQHDKLLSEVHRKICCNPKEWSSWRMLLQEGMTMSFAWEIKT
jgi:hypothetical protein